MPVAGYPLIVLIAKRLKHENFNIIIATSKHESDDDLCKLLDLYKIKYFRGDLKNVYKRFCDCIKTFKNNYLTLRLTGDNPFIDFRIINQVVKEFLLKKKNYNYIDYRSSNVPYGISVEVFKQKFLKNLKPKNSLEKEHVTICARNFKNNKFKSNIVFFNSNYSNLNCSIDNLNDYLLINFIFSKAHNPLRTSWKDLCKILKKYKNKKLKNLDLNKKIILGTAQLGDKYGVNNFFKINKKNIDSLNERIKLIDCASKLGITKFDTARVYENSENILGLYSNTSNAKIEVHTKISDIETRKKNIMNKIKFSINQSVTKLKKKKIKILYFHNYKNLISLNSKNLKFVKKLSSCKNIGVSIYETNELDFLMKNKSIDYFQIPFNILDTRFKNFFSIFKRNKKKFIVRSIFLQGLIFSSHWPKIIKNYKKNIIKKLYFFAKKFNRVNLIDLCLAYVNFYKDINGVVVGIDNKSQLFQLFSFLNNKPLKYNQIKEIDKYFKKIPKIVYDTRGWTA